MGINHYVCEFCDDVFSGASYHGHCGSCEATLCGDCYDGMREVNGEIGESHEKSSLCGEKAPNCCYLCDGTVIDDGEFINFLVNKTGKSREELESEFKAVKE